MTFKDWVSNLFHGVKEPEPPAPAPPAETDFPPRESHEPDYVTLARSHLGRNEKTDIAWIMNLFRYTSYPLKYVNEKTAWCAAGICMLMEILGYKSTRSAAAKDQGKLGVEMSLQEPYGVCWWEHLTGDLKGRNHTNIALEAPMTREVKTPIACLGYNQNNSVNVAKYGAPHYALRAYRKPVKK